MESELLIFLLDIIIAWYWMLKVGYIFLVIMWSVNAVMVIQRVLLHQRWVLEIEYGCFRIICFLFCLFSFYCLYLMLFSILFLTISTLNLSLSRFPNISLFFPSYFKHGMLCFTFILVISQILFSYFCYKFMLYLFYHILFCRD